jgi:hypothetical protein
MDEQGKTPAQRMTDEEYREYIIGTYGHIRGLAKTLLAIRKGAGKGAQNSEDFSNEDKANYHRVKEDVDRARRMLNRLHVRLYYAEKEKSYGDIPYYEIRAVLDETLELLRQANEGFVLPELARQREELMTDYIDY